MSEIQPNSHNIVNKTLIIAGMSTAAAAAVALGANVNSEPTPPAGQVIEAPVSSTDAYMQNQEMNEAYNDAGKTAQAGSAGELPSVDQNPDTHIVIQSVPVAEAPQVVYNGPGLSNVTAPGTNRLVN